MTRLDVVVKQPFNVCSVGEDTKILSELAICEYFDGCKVLDIGTGTGYIAISLAKLGAIVHATDVDENVLIIAEENAKLNNTKIKLIKSNLFESISEKYDIITFNPPISNAPSILKNFVRKIPLIKYIVPLYLSAFKPHRKILQNFLNNAKKHLTSNGKIITTAPLCYFEKIAEKEGFKKLKHVKETKIL